MKRRRVKITGIGPVTPAGVGREAFWRGILEPVSRVTPYLGIAAEFGPFVAAHIAEFDVGKYIPNRGVLPKSSARHTLFAVAGAVLALEDAGMRVEDLRNLNSVIVTGSSLMDFGGISNSTEAVFKRGARGAIARTIFTTNITSVPDAINRVLDTTGRAMAVQNSCCSGLDAIGYAASLIADGGADIAICGGTEAPLHRCPLLELRAAGLTPVSDELPARIARPFDLWRTTGVVSEGACMFILEPDSSPRKGYSYVSGYAFASDTIDDLCGGMTNAGRLAMADAKIRPSDTDVISAWGPGHKFIDEAEARAMNDLFGGQLREIPVSSIKGSIGSPLGAAPAIQVGAAALGQRFSVIPPTVNWDFPDPACPFSLSNRPRSIEHKVTLVNSHGVGSVNASIILERC
jgi:3-oxoacyl-[acyl-carrier-protein] synthase II